MHVCIYARDSGTGAAQKEVLERNGFEVTLIVGADDQNAKYRTAGLEAIESLEHARVTLQEFAARAMATGRVNAHDSGTSAMHTVAGLMADLNDEHNLVG